MPLQKNQILTLRIERLSSDGSGVAHSADGEAVFVPGTAPGDEARVRIVKDCGRYAFGILDELLTPSPDRVPVDCPRFTFGNSDSNTKNLSRTFPKSPISAPLTAVMIIVPTPMPRNLPKKASFSTHAAARQQKSKHVLNFGSAMLYLRLSILTKKSYTCG